MALACNISHNKKISHLVEVTIGSYFDVVFRLHGTALPTVEGFVGESWSIL